MLTVTRVCAICSISYFCLYE